MAEGGMGYGPAFQEKYVSGLQVSTEDGGGEIMCVGRFPFITRRAFLNTLLNFSPSPSILAISLCAIPWLVDMTLDMATYSSLLQSAKAVHDLGDLKVASGSAAYHHSTVFRIHD